MMFCTLTSTKTFSQSDLVRSYKFQHLDLELNSNRVETIEQDSYGYMWFGTIAGLHKFDGVNLTEYLYGSDSNSINASRIFKIFEDSKKRLWITTENGLYQYQRPYDNFKRYWTDHPDIDKGAFQNRIWDIFESSDGHLYMAGAQNGLEVLDEKEDEFRSVYSNPHPLATNIVIRRLAERSPGVFIAGTDSSGVVEFNTLSKTVTPIRGSSELNKLLDGVEVHRILIDINDRLWCALDDNGLLRINDLDEPTNFNHFTSDYRDQRTLFNNRVDDIFQDKEGNIWACNQNGGLHLYEERSGSFTRFRPDPNNPFSISSMAIRTIFQDMQGRLWVGSHLNGIDVFDKYLYKFSNYYSSDIFNSISGDVVKSFYEDPQENLWIVLDGGGLNYFDRRKNWFTHYMQDPSQKGTINSNATLSITKDNSGKFWIGTWRGGINVFNPRTKVFSTPYENIEGLRDIYHVHTDKRGNMWVGASEHGLTIFSPDGEFIAKYEDVSKERLNLGDDNILDFFEDSNGQMWIATEFNGVRMVIDGNDLSNLQFESYLYDSEDSTSVANVCVNHIFEDSKNRLWFATEGGLNLYTPEKKSFIKFGTKHGFLSNNIRSIEEDNSGNLWLGTGKGLTKFNPDTKAVRNYTKDDGLQPAAFSKYSVLKMKSGELAFGGYKGFNIFHPDSLFDNPNLSQVQLTGLKIFNEPMDIGASNSPLKKDIGFTKELVLEYSNSVFSIGYVGINMTQPERNQYAYRMLNFDDNWNYVGNKREATYTNLDPGEYVFQVKASNNDGLWGDDLVSLNITVLPPWWATTYFRVGLMILLMLIIVGIIRYRTYSLLQQRKELERLVDERTQEVKKLNQDLTISEKMASLGTFTAGIAHEINNPINFISGATQKLFDLYEIKLQTEKEKKNKDEEQIFINLKKIIKIGIERTTEIISSLRNYARNEQVRYERHNIVRCCEDSITILSHKINLGQVSLVKDYPDEVLIDCVPGKLSQVFINLLSNAVDAIGDKGEIHISIQPYGDHVKIGVSDNGKGISDEELSKLFDPFYSTKEVGKGTGLGLYIVYGIIEEHEGSISASSDQNGTHFQINLPVTHSQSVIEGV